MGGAATQAFHHPALASPRQPGRPGRGRAYDQVTVSTFGAAGEEVVGREHVVGRGGGPAPAAVHAVESQLGGLDRHSALLDRNRGQPKRASRQDVSRRNRLWRNDIISSFPLRIRLLTS